METKISIEKLNNTNYSSWKFKMQMILTREGVWRSMNSERPEESGQNYDKWLDKDEKARALISLAVEDSQFNIIRNKITSKETWDALREFHEKSSTFNQVTTMRRLFDTKMTDDKSIEEHIEEIAEYLQKLSDLEVVGFENDTVQVSILLSSLPESYNTMITALEVRPKSELTWSIVTSKLIEEYNRRRNNSESTEKLLKIKGENNSKNNGYKFCRYCKKTNHNINDCWKLKNKKKNKLNTIDDQKEEDTDEKLFSIHSKITNDWIIDSGATSHFSNNIHTFTTMREIDQSVKVANGSSVQVQGIGECKIQMINEKNVKTKVKLTNVLYVPELNGNFISIMKLSKNKYSVSFEENKCEIKVNNEQIGVAYLSSNLYILNQEQIHVLNSIQNKQCIHYWHRVLGHRNNEAIKTMINNNLVNGIHMDKCNCQNDCEICLKAKMTRKPFAREKPKTATQILDVIYSDLCGPMQTVSPNGKKYILTFIDEFSRYTKVYFLSLKSEVKDKIIEFTELCKTQKGSKPKVFHTDRGGEYVNNDVQNYLKSQGIKYEYTPPRTPQLNGIAERKNRTLVEMARCMLYDANLPNKFWAEAISTATYIQNRIITKGTNITPYEIWNKVKPNLKHLAVFGSNCFVKVNDPSRKKLDFSSTKMILLGFDNNLSYRCYNPDSQKVIFTRDIRFITSNQVEIPLNKEQPSELNDDASDIELPAEDVNYDRPIEIDRTTIDRPIIVPRRSTRINKGIPPKRYGLEYANSITEPRNFNEAIAHTHKDEWIRAMNEEIQSLTQKNTWNLTTLPENSKAIGSRWVYNLKTDASGKIVKFKARLVAQGFSQRFGIDYNQVFAPTAKNATFRILLSIASREGLVVHHLDVKTAYLNANVEEKIYMKQPPGFAVSGKEDHVCLLNKSIYGLKQSAKAWNDTINKILLKLNFRRSTADQCLYYKINQNDEYFLLIYVDDIIIVSKTITLIDEVKKQLNNEFEVRDLGEVKYYLGIQVEKSSDGIYSINQSKYIDELINKFQLQDAKTSNIPIDPSYGKSREEILLQSNEKYQQLIGSLLYITINTRPDIAVSVCLLSQKIITPNQEDWNELKRVLKYLKGTKNMKLFLAKYQCDDNLIGFADTNYGENRIDRKSNSGFIFKFNGGIISWACRKQQCVSLSSTEAELISLCEAVKEAIWLQNILLDLNRSEIDPITIYEDNQSCMKLIQNQKISNRSKHIDIKYFYIRDLIDKNSIHIEYCPSDNMVADIMTKPLQNTKFSRLRQYLLSY